MESRTGAQDTFGGGDERPQSDSGLWNLLARREAEIRRLRAELEESRRRELAAQARTTTIRRSLSDLARTNARFAASIRRGAVEWGRARRRDAAQLALGRILETSSGLEEAVPQILRVLGERLGWEVGFFWRREGDELRCGGVWRSNGRPAGPLIQASLSLGRGQELPGLAWESGEVAWIEDLCAGEGSERREAAAAEGLRGALALPIREDGFSGVLEFFRCEPLVPEEDLRQEWTLIGGQISQLVERRNAERERDEALARERAVRREISGILESISDAFFAFDEDLRFVYVNREAERLLRCGRAGLIGRKADEGLPWEPGSEPYEAMRRAAAEGIFAAFETYAETLGAWISGRVYPSEGGVSVYLQDITERKAAGKALRAAAERDRFRVALSDALRPLTDAAEIQATAARVIGEHLEVSRAFYFTAEREGQSGGYVHVITRDYLRHPEMQSAVGRYPQPASAENLYAGLPKGEKLVIEDINRLSERARGFRERYLALGIRSLVAVPLVKDGRYVAAFEVNDAGPRDWTANEIALVEETAERTWSAVERAHAEKALRESELRFRTLVENVPGAIYRCAPSPPWTMRFISERVEEITGYPSAEFLEGGARSFENVMHPEDRGRVVSEVMCALERREPYVLEYRILHADGSVRWVSETGSGAFSEGGEALWLDGVMLDISDRKRAQEALRRSEQRYRSLVTTSSSIVWATGAAGVATRRSLAWEEFTGQRPEEYLGSGWLDAVHPGDRERVAEVWERAREEGEPFEVEGRLRGRGGGYRYVQARGVPIRDPEGRVLEWTGTLTDVHDRKVAEEERERALRREWTVRAQAGERRRIGRELHDRVAHWMAVVHQSLELYEALKDANPEAARHRLKIARQTVKEALRHTRDLSMLLRRPEVSRGLEAALADLLFEIAPPDMEPELSVLGDEELLTTEARNQLFLILREAVRNAVAHAACSKVRVRVEISPEGISASVADDGCGFEAAKGVGKEGGLRYMKERARLFGGELKVCSEPGHGTRVEIRAPLKGGSRWLTASGS